MKNVTTSLAVLMFVVFVGSAIAGEPSLRNPVYISYTGLLTVDYNTGGDGTLWIGASVRDEDGNIRDLPHSRISGSSTKTWTMVGGYEEARISIWRDYDEDSDRMVERLCDTGWFR